MIDEQARHEAFERECGGPDRAFRLLRIYEATPNSSSLLQSPSPFRKQIKNKIQMFRERAKREGYTPKQIQMFLDLQ